MKLVKEEVLNPLGPPSPQHLGPLEATQVGQLSGQRQHREVEHEPEREPGVLLREGYQLEEVLGRVEDGAHVKGGAHFDLGLPEELPRQGFQRVVRLPHKFPCRKVCVTHQPSRGDGGAHEGVSKAGGLLLVRTIRHLASLHPSKPAPVGDLEVDHSPVHDVQVEGQDVVADEDVGVQGLEPCHNVAEQGPLRVEVGDDTVVVELSNVGGVPLLALPFESNREGLAFQPPDAGEVPELPQCVPLVLWGGQVRLDLLQVHHRARYDLGRGLIWCNVGLEVDRCHSERWVAVRLLADGHKLGGVHLVFLFGPCNLALLRHSAWVGNLEPARALELPLQDQVLRDRRLGSKHATEVLTRGLTLGQLWQLCRVLDLDDPLHSFGNPSDLERVVPLDGNEGELGDTPACQDGPNLVLQVGQLAVEQPHQLTPRLLVALCDLLLELLDRVCVLGQDYGPGDEEDIPLHVAHDDAAGLPPALAVPHLSEHAHAALHRASDRVLAVEVQKVEIEDLL
mmetsp:Transcript_3169/g.9575  ORF Transcript_3169/g.9575 Transcript_3169/m.9575 type:complete len:509 (+) Transcript_3169:1842-3368(+)